MFLNGQVSESNPDQRLDLYFYSGPPLTPSFRPRFSNFLRRLGNSTADVYYCALFTDENGWYEGYEELRVYDGIDDDGAIYQVLINAIAAGRPGDLEWIEEWKVHAYIQQ